MSVGGRLAQLEKQTGGADPVRVVVNWAEAGAVQVYDPEDMRSRDPLVRVVTWEMIDGGLDDDDQER